MRISVLQGNNPILCKRKLRPRETQCLDKGHPGSKVQSPDATPHLSESKLSLLPAMATGAGSFPPEVSIQRDLKSEWKRR